MVAAAPAGPAARGEGLCCRYLCHRRGAPPLCLGSRPPPHHFPIQTPALLLRDQCPSALRRTPPVCPLEARPALRGPGAERGLGEAGACGREAYRVPHAPPVPRRSRSERHAVTEPRSWRRPLSYRDRAYGAQQVPGLCLRSASAWASPALLLPPSSRLLGPASHPTALAADPTPLGRLALPPAPLCAPGTLGARLTPLQSALGGGTRPTREPGSPDAGPNPGHLDMAPPRRAPHCAFLEISPGATRLTLLEQSRDPGWAHTALKEGDGACWSNCLKILLLFQTLRRGQGFSSVA